MAFTMKMINTLYLRFARKSVMNPFCFGGSQKRKRCRLARKRRNSLSLGEGAPQRRMRKNTANISLITDFRAIDETSIIRLPCVRGAGAKRLRGCRFRYCFLGQSLRHGLPRVHLPLHKGGLKNGIHHENDKHSLSAFCTEIHDERICFSDL